MKYKINESAPPILTEEQIKVVESGDALILPNHIAPLEFLDKDCQAPKEKKRKPDSRRQASLKATAPQLCPMVMIGAVEDGQICSRRKCQGIHSKEEYAKVKLEDLNVNCLKFRECGVCLSDLNCRCFSSHDTTYSNKEIIDKILEKKPTYPFNVLNKLDPKIPSMIKKGDYNFETGKYPFRESSVLRKERNDDFLVPGEDYFLGPIPKKKIDFRDQLILAPMMTLGTLPSRLWAKDFGADITVSEMTLAKSFSEGKLDDFSRCYRHPREDLFGVQVSGSLCEMKRATGLLVNEVEADYFELNAGCPQLVASSNLCGASLLEVPDLLFDIGKQFAGYLHENNIQSTLKMRMGPDLNNVVAKDIIKRFADEEVPFSAITLHGRGAKQRYNKSADWGYIGECQQMLRDINSPIKFIGNGDIYNIHSAIPKATSAQVDSIMIGRGFLFKPWIFKEIKLGITLDPTSSERIDYMRTFAGYMLDFYGSNAAGVEKARTLLLEHLSFLCRYVPTGILQNPVANEMNLRPSRIIGRDHMETLLSSNNPSDWLKITEIILGPAPSNSEFEPSYKSKSY